MNSRSAQLMLAAVCLAAPAAVAQSVTWTVVNLTPSGYFYATADGVDGTQVVGAATNVDFARATLWNGSANSVVRLQNSSDRSGEGGTSFAAAIHNGQQVGGRVTDVSYYARLWTGQSSAWIDLNPRGAVESIAHAVYNGRQGGVAAFQANATGMFSRAGMWSGSAESWTSMHPAGVSASMIYGMDGAQQVGATRTPGPIDHAALWSGTHDSWIDLNPAGAEHSIAQAVSEGEQVGIAVYLPDFVGHACLWRGSASSFVDLHPAGADYSRAFDCASGEQVGYTRFPGQAEHAALWSGSANSRFDLGTLLPPQNYTSEAHGISRRGPTTYIVGNSYNGFTNRLEAIMWIRQAVCPADFNTDGAVDSADFFAFLAAFFVSDGAADYSQDGAVTSQDFFGYISAFFTGC